MGTMMPASGVLWSRVRTSVGFDSFNMIERRKKIR